VSGIIDFHNHIIPGVDDGAQSVADSLAALRAMMEHGVTHVIVTPHFDGSLTLHAPTTEHPGSAAARLEELDAGWSRLQAAAAEVPGITISRGAEVMLDVLTPDLSDIRLHLAGGPFVLVEFPFMTVPPGSGRALHTLRTNGVLPIVAHPERYHGVTPGSRLPARWKAAGAFLQMNGAALLGRYGKVAKSNAEDLLSRGLIDFMCSDYHARGSPRVQEYRAWLTEHGGSEQCELLTETNPARMLAGELPLDVPPLRTGGSAWGKLLPWKK
jgi:protein-tyrosine phosphatase